MSYSKHLESPWYVINGVQVAWPLSVVLVSSGCQNKHRRLGGFNNRNFFLTGLEAGKSKIKVPGNSVPGEGSSWMAAATFLWSAHLQTQREGSGLLLF